MYILQVERQWHHEKCADRTGGATTQTEIDTFKQVTRRRNMNWSSPVSRQACLCPSGCPTGGVSRWLACVGLRPKDPLDESINRDGWRRGDALALCLTVAVDRKTVAVERYICQRSTTICCAGYLCARRVWVQYSAARYPATAFAQLCPAPMPCRAL